MSASVVLITVHGRKSGTAYTLPVQYAQEGQTIYILPGAPQQKTWWRNLRGGATVTLWLRGQAVQAQAELVSGDAGSDALKVYYRRFPTSARLAHVSTTPDRSFNAAELATRRHAGRHRARQSSVNDEPRCRQYTTRCIGQRGSQSMFGF